MWALMNQTPFSAERAGARDRAGAEIWLVAVKGTFLIRTDGSIELAARQEPVLTSPVYLGKPGHSGLRYDVDLARTKPATDILLHGHAYSPNLQPVRFVNVALSVGSVHKTLRVFGDRRWNSRWLGPELSDPEPFVKMPLVYELAFGGEQGDPPQRDSRNPIGRGFVTRKSELPGKWAPNIEYPEGQKRAAGFGPICSDWSPRRERAGTYDDIWQETRKPLLPADFDDRFFQAAPDDQQATGYLRGGEKVELVNLAPEGLLRFRLPRVALGFMTRFGRRSVYHRANLHTVVIEPDVSRVLLVWHTAIPCHHDLYKLTDTRIYMKQLMRSLEPVEPRQLPADRAAFGRIA